VTNEDVIVSQPGKGGTMVVVLEPTATPSIEDGPRAAATHDAVNLPANEMGKRRRFLVPPACSCGKNATAGLLRRGTTI
jgi:hypothetical protein